MSNVARLHISPPTDTVPENQVNDQAPAVVKIGELKFRWNESHAPVLNIAALTINRGERIFISGPSGSGKSTLLNLLGGLVVPQKGRVSVLGHQLDALSSAERDRFRADHIGFIFQNFNLIPYLSVIENVTLPCRFSRQRRRTARKLSPSLDAEAARLLSQLGISTPDLLKRSVTELSVGQQQRVAAARALIGAPEIVIADEPTSSLDAAHRRAFIQLLFDECAQTRSTLVFVSHDTSLAPQFDRTIRLPEINRVGRVTSEYTGEDA